MCVIRLQADQPPPPSVDIESVVSFVSEDLRSAGARERLIERVETSAQKARPKLIGFRKSHRQDSDVEIDQDNEIMYAVYLNRMVREFQLYIFACSQTDCIFVFIYIGPI